MYRLKHILVVFALGIASCTPRYTMIRNEASQVRLNKEATIPDSTMSAEILPYKSKLDAALSEVLAVSAQPMEKGTPEGVLGNFVADACLSKARQLFALSNPTRVDFCFLNNGGLRTALPQGNITRNKIYELMPFENELVCITINGTTAKKLFNFIAAKGGMPVSGVTMAISGNEANQIRIDSIAFSENREYVVATSDYLAGGGDDLGFLSEAKQKTVLNKKVRDAIMEYLMDENKKGKTIIAKTDGRIIKK